MTQTIEQVWATEGPDWSEPTEVMAYSDWLEEQGRDAEAFGARWLMSAGRRPAPVESGKYSWWVGGQACIEDVPRARDSSMPAQLLDGPTKPWLLWHDAPDRDSAYMIVINRLKAHPERVNLLKGTP